MLNLDKDALYNNEIMEIKWISLDDHEKFDRITDPIRKQILLIQFLLTLVTLSEIIYEDL